MFNDRGNPSPFPSTTSTDVTKTGNGERGAGSGERGAGNGERKSGNELSAETPIKINMADDR